MIYTGFIIATNSGIAGARGLSASEKDVLTEYLRSMDGKVWHWFEDLWIVAFDKPRDLSTAGIMDGISAKLLKRPDLMIFPLVAEGTGGFAPEEPLKWIAENLGGKIVRYDKASHA